MRPEGDGGDGVSVVLEIYSRILYIEGRWICAIVLAFALNSDRKTNNRGVRTAISDFYGFGTDIL